MGVFRRRTNYPKCFRYFKEEITQLKELGYHDVQIKEIFRSLANVKANQKLNAAEQEEIRDKLNNYIEFAKKALRN